MKKINLLKVLAIALVVLLILPVVASAYEMEGEYTISIPEELIGEADGTAEFNSENRRMHIDIYYCGDVEEGEDIYTEEAITELVKRIDEAGWDVDFIDQNLNQNNEGITYDITQFDISKNSEEITTFTKNSYKCIKVSRAFVIQATSNQAPEEFLLFYDVYLTVQNNRIYSIDTWYEEDNASTIESAIKSLTFGDVEEPEEEATEEEPEEDDTKKDGKIAQAGVTISFEAVAMSMLVVCGVLLVVNNKRR